MVCPPRPQPEKALAMPERRMAERGVGERACRPQRCLVPQLGHCGFRGRFRTDLLPAGQLPTWLGLSRWPPCADLCSGFLTQGPLLASSRLDGVVSRLQDRHAARRRGWTSVLSLVLPGPVEQPSTDPWLGGQRQRPCCSRPLPCWGPMSA